jgi:hypothetical protein
VTAFVRPVMVCMTSKDERNLLIAVGISRGIESVTIPDPERVE